MYTITINNNNNNNNNKNNQNNIQNNILLLWIKLFRSLLELVVVPLRKVTLLHWTVLC